MNRTAALAIALAASLTQCQPAPIVPPPPGGAGGAPTAGAGGAAGSPGGGAGGFGGYDPGGPAGAAGAPNSDVPLCALPRSPEADAELDKFRLELGAALTQLFWGNLDTVRATWLTYREDFTLVAVPPAGGAWTLGRLEQVVFKMPGGGHFAQPVPGCQTCGYRNPCADEPPRVMALSRDAGALP
jgi:hypothetical protein